MKEALRLLDVAADLDCEGLRAGEAAFLPQTLEEGEAQRRVFRQVNRVKVKEVSFHSVALRSEGRPVSGVGHSPEGWGVRPVPNAKLGDVHTIGGEKFDSLSLVL